MVTIILVPLLVYSSNYVLSVFYNRYNNIIKTANEEIAVSIRKKFSYIRFCIWILTATIIIIILYNEDNLFYVYLCFMFLVKVTDIGFNIKYRILPISVKQLKDISQEEKFVLYLRGFSSDNYSGVRTLVDQSDFNSFSEYHFIKIFNKYLPVYTVGMTKELLSPLGAKRIYLDDENWEEGVSKLIDMAEIVIVLVNDSKNCIIEIEKCYNLNKTILIVDDIKKLTTVSEHFNSNPFPTSIKPHTLLFNYNSHNAYSTLAYENTWNSYRKNIKQLMKERYGVSRLVLPLLLVHPSVVFLFIIMSFIPIIRDKGFNNEVIMYFLLINIIFVIVTIAYSQPMSKWRKIKKKEQG